MQPAEQTEALHSISEDEQAGATDGLEADTCLHTALPAKSLHSVWSLSASSDESSADSRSLQTSPCPPAGNSVQVLTEASDCSSCPDSPDLCLDGKLHFQFCIGNAECKPETDDVMCRVDANTPTPAFDPEVFILQNVHNALLQHHRLTDYGIELVADGGNTGQWPLLQVLQDCHSAQRSSSQQSVLLLIAAIFKPGTPSTNASIKCTILVASVNIISGATLLPL